MNVYEILFPPNEQYQGMVHISVLNKQKIMKSLGSYSFSDLSKRIETLQIMKSRNYYITANSFFPFSSRSKSSVFGLHNIVFDFDIHQRMNQYSREQLISEFIWRIKRDVFNVGEPYQIPVNVIHNTTRGIQVWIHIDSASSKLMWLYQKTIDCLMIVFKEFLSEYPEMEKHITIDCGASSNSAGLYRLFGTWNTHTQKKTQVEILRSDSIDLNELFRKVCEHDAVQDKIREAERRAEQYQKKKEAGKKSSQTKRQGNSYDVLQRKRLAFIKWWDTQQEDSVGKRDMMIYLGYNAAIQIMTQEEAQKWCRKLNAGFTEPLKDISYIFKEIQKPFQIRNTTFYEMLGVDPEEQHRFETEYSKTSMNLTRNAILQKRKAEKERKKEQARKMIMDGLPYKEIAQTVGFSLSTIKNLASTVAIRKKTPKPWEELGISKSTYYRKRKETNDE